MTERTGRGKCLLVWLLVLGLLAGVVAGIGLPWWAKMQFYDKVIDQSAERIARYQRLIESKPMLNKAFDDLRRQLTKSGQFIQGGSPELAAAELQTKVKQIVGRAGGKLVSTQNLGEAGEGGLRRIDIKVRMKGDVAALAKVLYELAQAKPRMEVREISVRSRRTVKGRRQNRVEGYELDVTFGVSGYLLEAKG